MQSDVPKRDEPERRGPVSTVQAVGRVAEDVVYGLKQQPVILAIVVLNIAAIICVVWFLSRLLERHSVTMTTVFELIRQCMAKG